VDARRRHGDTAGRLPSANTGRKRPGAGRRCVHSHHPWRLRTRGAFWSLGPAARKPE
jgi:hypothetical protein